MELRSKSDEWGGADFSVRGGDEDNEKPHEKWLQLEHHRLMSSNYCTGPR